MEDFESLHLKIREVHDSWSKHGVLIIGSVAINRSVS